MIWDELQEQKKILNELRKREISNSVEECSLNKAARMLKLAPPCSAMPVSARKSRLTSSAQPTDPGN